ncbi:flagellar biosynthesis anti-sigma factor FlgM [Aerolutibacter ruishenii]|uniref:Negative regulator of flagellin synthesis n=1 Tax=Aerolutibacter ruishenii TaxID=686800 RepID=A0A562LN60_9GAMM|nr:flagellar biosynthesis anti-sigma factor FlgM [Lysobacter ruishenii]TWI09041.1 FlgM family anti-sigma-28 factor [Lysobacter ruishenii]
MTSRIDATPVPAARPVETAQGSTVSRAGNERGAPVVAAAPSESLRLTGEAEGLMALERKLGNAPAGLDLAKVESVRAAIANGSYRVDPQAIAERMLDLDAALGG